MALRWLRGGFSRLTGGGSPRSSGNMVLYLLRGCFGAIIIGSAWLAFEYFNQPPTPGSPPPHPAGPIMAFVAILAAGFCVVAADLLIKSKQITTISAVY